MFVSIVIKKSLAQLDTALLYLYIKYRVTAMNVLHFNSMLYHCIGTKMILSGNSLLVFITTYIFDFMIYFFILQLLN